MVDSLACGLKARGIEKGDRIGVLGKNSLVDFLLYGAAAALGAIMLPINWRLSPGEVCFNLQDGGAKIVFADNEFAETLIRARSALGCAGLFPWRRPGCGRRFCRASAAG